MKVNYIETQDEKIRIVGFEGMNEADMEKRFGAEVCRIYKTGLNVFFKTGLNASFDGSSAFVRKHPPVRFAKTDWMELGEREMFFSCSCSYKQFGNGDIESDGFEIKNNSVLTKSLFETFIQALRQSKERFEEIVEAHRITLVRSVNF